MGRASSSKKVARAAGIGAGRAKRGRTPWSYYGVLAIVVILGVLGVVNARDRRAAQVNAQGVGHGLAVGTNNYEGFAVDLCGKLVPSIKTTKDPYGITTKGDGIIYISPTVKSAAGANATLGKFASSIGMVLNSGEVQVPGRRLYREGDSCGSKPGRVYVMEWNNPAAPQQDGVLATKAADEVPLANDKLVTIAFVPASDKNKILQPPASTVHKLVSLEAAAANAGSTTTSSTPATAHTSTAHTSTTQTSTTTGSTTKPAANGSSSRSTTTGGSTTKTTR